MGRPLRIDVPFAVYHVTARGNHGQDIYLDVVDRERFLKRLGFVMGRLGLVCHSYCLMNNHFHLLLETTRPNLGRAMQQLLSGYALSLHKRLATAGHLFQGRYHAVLVEKGAHMLEAARYVALNPVRAGLCQQPEEWPWSAHRALCGIVTAEPCLTVDWLLRQFAKDLPTARRRYRAFVAEPTPDRRASDGAIVVGTPAFAERHLAGRAMDEAPKRQSRLPRPSLAELRSTHGDRAILVAYRQYDYRLREIAGEFELHYSTISRRLAALEDATSSSDTRQRKI